MFRAAFLTLCITVLSELSWAAQVSAYNIGNWLVAIHTDGASGQFSSCVASVNYNSGITLFVVVSRDYQWDLAFSAAHWKLQPGERISLQYRFDRSAWTGATAEVVSENLVRMPMPSDGQVARLFRRGRTMEVKDGYQSYFFHLDGTSQLLVSLVQCVETSTRPGQAVSSAPAVGSPSPGGSPGADVASLRLEGTRVLSNFLLAAEIAGAELLSEQDFPQELSFAHAVAVAGEAIGFSLIVPAIELTPDAITAQISGAVSEACQGRFGTGSTKETVENIKLINAFTACQNEGTRSLLQYVVVSRKSGGQYVVGVLSATAQGGSEKSSTLEPPLDSARLMNAALKISQ